MKSRKKDMILESNWSWIGEWKERLASMPLRNRRVLVREWTNKKNGSSVGGLNKRIPPNKPHRILQNCMRIMAHSAVFR